MTATTITLFIKTLRDAVTCGLSHDADAEFDAALPTYIERLQAALPAGCTLAINRHDLSTASLRDDDDQQLAQELDQIVDFWN